MESVEVRWVDSVHCMVECDDGIAQELADLFTFKVPDAHFNPKYKLGVWDGKIRLFSPLDRLLYVGSLYKVVEYCASRGYGVAVDPRLKPSMSAVDEGWLDRSVAPGFERRDYQLRIFRKALLRDRSLIMSPTSSGKSLIIWLLAKRYHEVTA